MFNKYTFWLRTTAALQILTGLIHSLSFLNKPSGSNDTEKQMIDLMLNYKNDMGAGFHPTMFDILTSLSACFSVLYLFGGALNFYLLRKNVGAEVLRGLINIEMVAYGIIAVVCLFMTFLPPIVLTSLVFIALVTTRLTASRA